MGLGFPRTELRRKLVDCALRGDKTATAGLRADHEPFTDDPLPRVGDRCMLLGFADEPVASPSPATREKGSRPWPTGVAPTRSSGRMRRSTTTR